MSAETDGIGGIVTSIGKRIIILVAALAALPAIAVTIPPPRFEDWPKPQAPFRIAGDLYYVGSKGLAAYLIRTPAGAILIDGTIAGNVPIIEANIRALGLGLGDVKILLNTHAHFDHAAGLDALKRDTHAMMIASAGDLWALEHGTSRGDSTADLAAYPPVKVDRTIADGDAVTLGGTMLTARLTPGHTPGCTSWTLPVIERGRRLIAVIPCSLSVAGNVLVGNRAYPGIVADYRRSFALLKGLKADIVLPAHPEVADVIGRHERAAAGKADAYLAPGLLAALTGEYEAQFDAELARQEKAKP